MIGEMKESSLHSMLKEYYRERDGGETESSVEGYVVDLLCDDHIVEIQTGNFSHINNKLLKLLDSNKVTLVYPLVRRKELLLLDESESELIRRRKSPLRGQPAHAAKELIRIPQLPSHPRFTFELLLVSVEEWRCDDGKGSWRRKGVSITDRKLLSIDEVHIFTEAADYLGLLPERLPELFTNTDVADKGNLSRSQASKLTWFLREIGVLGNVGKRGRSYLFRRLGGE